MSGHSKIDKTKVVKTDGSLIQVESIAECSLGAFCNTFDLHKVIIGHENQFWVVFFEWPLKTGFTVLLHLLLYNCINISLLQEKIRLKYKLTYSMNDQNYSDVGDVEGFNTQS